MVEVGGANWRKAEEKGAVEPEEGGRKGGSGTGGRRKKRVQWNWRKAEEKTSGTMARPKTYEEEC